MAREIILDKELLKKGMFKHDERDEDEESQTAAFQDVLLTVLKVLIFAFNNGKKQACISRYTPLFNGLFPRLVRKWSSGTPNVPMVNTALQSLVQGGYIQEEVKYKSDNSVAFRLHIIDEKYKDKIASIIGTDEIPEAQDDAIAELIESAHSQTSGGAGNYNAVAIISKLFGK